MILTNDEIDFSKIDEILIDESGDFLVLKGGTAYPYSPKEFVKCIYNYYKLTNEDVD